MQDNKNDTIYNPNTTPGEEANTQSSWQYTSGELTANNQQSYINEVKVDQNEVIAEWSAQEFIEQQKGPKWYVLLALGSIVGSLVLFLVTKEAMSVVVTLLLALAVGVFGSAKPKIVKYTIDSLGVAIDNKHYNFSEFKSFSIINGVNANIPYIQLIPQKRLMLPLTIFIDPKHSDEIAEIIGQFVPYDQKQPDLADKISSRFRF